MTNNKVTKIFSRNHKRFAYYNNKGYRLPESGIFDLSRVSQDFDGITVNDVINIWKWTNENIKEIISKYEGFADLIFHEKANIEIRIVSDCVDSLEMFKKQILSKAISELHIKRTNRKTLNLLARKMCANQKILCKFRKDYDYCGPKEGFEEKFKLYSENKIYTGDVWKEVESLGDYFIFIAHSGVPFIGGFYETTGNNNIALTEFHRESDPYSQYRKSPYDGKYFSSINGKKGSRPIIIDKSYTGSTLNFVKQRYPGSKTVALFPKTQEGMESCDYFILNNKLFCQSNINTKKDDWYINLYKESLET